MERSDLQELGYITPIANLPSMMERGLLSHRRAQRLNAASIAMAEIQARREVRAIPGGLAVHDYVNLYICPRNPMLRKRLSERHDICVLSVDPAVLDIEGVVVSDRNVASGYARFAPGASGLDIVDRELTFAEWWTD